MKSKIFIIISLLVSLIMWASFANAFDDDWQLQQRQFEMDLQFQQQQFRQMQQELRQQMQFMKQQQFPIEQFGWQVPFGQQMRWQQNVTPIVIDSSLGVSPRSSLLLKNFETAGITNLNDHIELLKTSIDMIRKGLTLNRAQFGPNTITAPSGQLVWTVKPIETTSTEFLRGVSTGLHFLGALLRDWDMMEKGSWSVLRSHSLEAVGSYGISEVRNFAKNYIKSLGSEFRSPIIGFTAKLTYGLPEFTKAASLWIGSGSITPAVKSSALRGIGYEVAGLMWGNAGTTALYFGEKISNYIATSLAMPQARSIIKQEYAKYVNQCQSKGLPVQNMIDRFGAEYLRGFGYGADIRGMPINRLIDLGTSRIEQVGFTRQSRLFDPDTGATTTTRQWSMTTRETTIPNLNVTPNWVLPQSNWNSIIGSQPNWSSIVGSPISSFTNPMNSFTNPMNNFKPLR